jgi:hypothetical protein
MNAKLTVIALAFAAGVASAAAPFPLTDEEKIARIQARLFRYEAIHTRNLPEQTTLAKFLAALEKRLPPGQKVPLRIDSRAFGKGVSRVAGASVKMPPMKAMLPTILRKAISQVSGEEVAIGVRPDGVVITRPRLAVQRVVYDIRDILPHLPEVLPRLKRNYPAFRDSKTIAGPGALIAFLLAEIETKEWESIRFLNRGGLEVIASPFRHDEVASLLHALRAVTDTAVVMNARLYEVDRAFYVKHVAPLFAKPRNPDERPRVIAITSAALLAQITRQKLLLQSEDDKLRPGRVAVFLARQTVFRYAAGPPDQSGRAKVGTGLEGVSFAVRPVVSDDRRSLRLTITRKVDQLVRIDKTSTLDVASGKDVEIESPNLRRTRETGTVEVMDGNPILMPVEYRPPGKENKDKVWLMAARPYIWIEEEVKEIRREGGDVTSKAFWDAPINKEEQEKPARPKARPALDDQTRQILQAIVSDVLTNSRLEDARADYGTPKDKTFALVDGEELGWPEEFEPRAIGYRRREARADSFGNRILGIYLSKFDLKQKKIGRMDTPIEVRLWNAGGTANGGVHGGCAVYYVPKRVGKRWTVQLVEIVGLVDLRIPEIALAVCAVRLGNKVKSRR